MANYIDNFNIDESRIKREVNQWKLELEEKVKLQIDPKQKIRRNILFTLNLLFFILGMIFLIFYLVFDLSSTYLSLMIIGFVIFGILLSILIFFEWKQKKQISAFIKKSTANEKVFEIWFSKIFDHEEISELYKESFATKETEITDLINKYKYKPAGASKVGVVETYNIMGGKIFNNPFNLACGVYFSYTQTKDSRVDYYEYMPILQVKTNSFKDLDLFVTNSKKFPGYHKNKILFDNISFREKYLIKSNSDLENMMIFTPLVQEKWVNAIDKLPQFQMHIKNGMINVLFQGNNSKFTPSTKPFMNIANLFKKSWTIKSFFKKLDSKIIDNLNIFSEILNIVFAISYFQWEDATDDKIPEITSRSETLVDSIIKNMKQTI